MNCAPVQQWSAARLEWQGEWGFPPLSPILTATLTSFLSTWSPCHLFFIDWLNHPSPPSELASVIDQRHYHSAGFGAQLAVGGGCTVQAALAGGQSAAWEGPWTGRSHPIQPASQIFPGLLWFGYANSRLGFVLTLWIGNLFDHGQLGGRGLVVGQCYPIHPAPRQFDAPASQILWFGLSMRPVLCLISNYIQLWTTLFSSTISTDQEFPRLIKLESLLRIHRPRFQTLSGLATNI